MVVWDKVGQKLDTSCRSRYAPAQLARSSTHTSAYVSIRQHTSAYVNMRQHTSASAAHTCIRPSRAYCRRRKPRPRVLNVRRPHIWAHTLARRPRILHCTCTRARAAPWCTWHSDDTCYSAPTCFFFYFIRMARVLPPRPE